jgi:hypothetical protein
VKVRDEDRPYIPDRIANARARASLEHSTFDTGTGVK